MMSTRIDIKPPALKQRHYMPILLSALSTHLPITFAQGRAASILPSMGYLKCRMRAGIAMPISVKYVAK